MIQQLIHIIFLKIPHPYQFPGNRSLPYEMTHILITIEIIRSQKVPSKSVLTKHFWELRTWIRTQSQTNSILWFRTRTLCPVDKTTFLCWNTRSSSTNPERLRAYTTKCIYLRESDFYEIVHVIRQVFGDEPHIVAIIFMTWTKYVWNRGQKRNWIGNS